MELILIFRILASKCNPYNLDSNLHCNLTHFLKKSLDSMNSEKLSCKIIFWMVSKILKIVSIRCLDKWIGSFIQMKMLNIIAENLGLSGNLDPKPKVLFIARKSCIVLENPE